MYITIIVFFFIFIYNNVLFTDSISYIFFSFHPIYNNYNIVLYLVSIHRLNGWPVDNLLLTFVYFIYDSHNRKLQSLSGRLFNLYLYNVYYYNIVIKRRAQSSPDGVSRQSDNNDNKFILWIVKTQSTYEMISSTFYTSLMFGIAMLISCSFVSTYIKIITCSH